VEAPNNFRLSHRSRSRLVGVHADLVRVVERAIAWSEVDFVVTEGVRSKARQAELVAAGASQTMNSRHLTGHAVDVVAVLGGRISWDWPLYFRIAEGFRRASNELGVGIVWGGAWGRALGGKISAERLHLDYIAERTKAGRKPFLDGPHFELSRREYP
jgi:peptidoglycan LD-endopeptidase CwlK